MPFSDQVDADRAREHVRSLIDGGMSISQIQFASGVDRTALRVLIGDFPNRKMSKQIRVGTERKILRTRLNRGVSIAGLVPSAGTRRRIQALAAIGYSQRYIAMKLGHDPTVQIARQELCRAESAMQVMDLYEELRDGEGPSRRTREFALMQGWLGPMWWDDDEIDDPLAVPTGTKVYRIKNPGRRGHQIYHEDLDEHAIERAMTGERVPLTPVERQEAILRLHALGYEDGAIGLKLGLTATAIQHARARGIAEGRELILLDDYAAPRAKRIALLSASGLSPEEIAQRLGTRLRYVHRDIREGRAS